MAATAKTHTSLKHNPAKGTTTLAAKPNAGTKTNKAKTGHTAAKKKAPKKNPSTTTTMMKKKVKRNPNFNQALTLVASGIGGGMVLGLADYAIQRFAPTASNNAQIGLKAGGAWLMHKFGNKIPVVGGYSKFAAGVLALFAGYDVWRYYVQPMLIASGFKLPVGFSIGLNQAPTQQTGQLQAMPQQKMIVAGEQNAAVWNEVPDNDRMEIVALN